MSRISLAINVDTRPVCNQFEGMWKGVRSRDFLSDGIRNKQKFFDGFELETIVHVDEHEPLTQQEYDTLHSLADCVIIRKHSKQYRGANPFNAFNDISYYQTLSMCRSNLVCHMDQDVAAFRVSQDVVQNLIDEVESDRYKFVCYPSPQSPDPCYAPQYQGKFWASTRFFLAKRDTLILDDLERGIRDNQWFYAKYGTPPVLNPWTESFLAAMANYSVLYPSVQLERWAVFPWQRYVDGTLARLDGMEYHQVSDAIRRCGGSGIFWDGADATLMQL